jgi:hypothetical protein
LFKELLVPHAALHLKILLGADTTWVDWHAEYGSFLEKLAGDIQRWRQDFLADVREDDVRRNIFGFRECDHVLENVTAVRLGIKKLWEQPELAGTSKVRVVGLPYGGIELPILSAVIGREQGKEIYMGFLRVSFYSDRGEGNRMRETPPGYVEEIMQAIAPPCLVGTTEEHLQDIPVFIADDNATTCSTLETARDVLVVKGADVRGAIVVRYPGVNRRLHMSFPGHGFPDPEILLSFVRGLVSPSPYSRLLMKGPTEERKYQDQSGVFNKAKKRIERLLMKNGTPVAG